MVILKTIVYSTANAYLSSDFSDLAEVGSTIEEVVRGLQIEALLDLGVGTQRHVEQTQRHKQTVAEKTQHGWDSI